MNELMISMLEQLGRTTLALAGAAAIVSLLLRLGRVSSAAVHRAGCVLALLVGWSFLRLSVAVPWYDAATAAPQEMAQLTTEPKNVQPAAEVDELASETHFKLPDQNASGTAAAKSAVETRGIVAAWVLAAWGFGLIAIAIAWLAGYARFVRRLPVSQAAEEAWLREWHKLLEVRGARSAIPLRVTLDSGPMLCRLPRGYELLVPASLWRRLSPSERACILRHELAHYERGDVWKSLAARVLALPHWFNPLAWWAVRRFDEAAEWACDHVATGDEPATAYARALLQLGEAAGRPAAYGPAARGRTLAGRIRRVLSGTPRKDSMAKKMILATAALLIAIAALVRVDLVANVSASEDVSPGETAEEVATSVAPPAGNQALVAAAQKAHKSALEDYANGRGTQEPVYDWSKRLLAAEQAAAATDAARITARRAHLTRMRKLREVCQLLIDANEEQQAKLDATDFYVTEAKQLAELATPPARPDTDTSNKPTIAPLLVSRASAQKPPTTGLLGLAAESRDRYQLTANDLATRGLSVAVATPAPPGQLTLRGNTANASERLARVRPRVAGEMVAISKVEPVPNEKPRELIFGDRVKKGQVLATIWSKDIGEKKNELMDALSRLRLGQKDLEQLKEVKKGVVPERSIREAERQVQSSEIAVSRAERTLRSWQVGEEEIKRVAAASEGDAQKKDPSDDSDWGRVDVVAPIDGTIVERNVYVGDIVDTSHDLFKIADLSQLLIHAHIPEEDLPALGKLPPEKRRWQIRVLPDTEATPIEGTFTVTNNIDPNQHTALVTGTIANPDGRLRAGQFVTATVEIAVDPTAVAIPSTAILQQGDGSTIFVQANGQESQFERRKILVTRWMENSALVRGEPTASDRAAGFAGIKAGEKLLAMTTAAGNRIKKRAPLAGAVAQPPAKDPLVDAARTAYEGALKAYLSGRGTLEVVSVWSQRWMAAEENSSGDPARRTAAARAHLDRMRDARNRVKALSDASALGGEAENLAAADYYVAEAERRVEKLKSEQAESN